MNSNCVLEAVARCVSRRTIGREIGEPSLRSRAGLRRAFPNANFGVNRRRSWLASLVALISALSLRALEIKLPADDTRLVESPLPGYALAAALCSTCHSADYIRYQPTSSRTYWKASIAKMQKTFGAPIPDDAVEPLVDYLVKTYGNERAGAATSSTAQPSASPASNPAKGSAPPK